MNSFQKSVAVVLSFFIMSANAALFDDKEARKKILDVQSQALENHEAQTAQIAGLEESNAIQSQGLQDMQEQIDLLSKEIAELRGNLEVANHALEIAEQRQKDLYTDTDERIRKLESGGAPIARLDGTPVVDGEDSEAYAAAYAFTSSAKHKEAFEAYEGFLKDYPQSSLVPNALYGMGYSQYVLKNYKASISTQQKMLDTYPDNIKAPDAMYSIANSQIQLGKIVSAKKTLRNLIQKFPESNVKANAEKRLKILDTIK